MIHKLEADNIFKSFGSRKILTDIYLRCETGKITGLLGRNGNGKTCLMNIISGNINAQSKSIRFDGSPAASMAADQTLLLYLPQFNFIPKTLTLKRIFSDFNIDFSTFEKIFPEFSLKYKSCIKELSGGQKRIVEIFVILKSSSKFVMLDEPFSFLSPILIEVIKELILEEKENKGILLTDHMFRQVIEISDDLYVLRDGKTYLTKSLIDLESLGYARL